MGHDTHFLSRLERLDTGQMAFALSLYRNVHYVKAIVEACAPEGSSRVAIGLDHTPDPPHALFERSGVFVTCLGAGMRHDLPVISRAAVDRALRNREQLRQISEEIHSYASNKAWVADAMRVFEGPRLSREEAAALLRWGPLTGSTYLEAFAEDLKRQKEIWVILARAEKLKARHTAKLARLWELAWGLGHLAGPLLSRLAFIYERGGPPAMGMRAAVAGAGLETCLLPSALRCAWTSIELNGNDLADLEQTYVTPGNGLHWAASLAIVGAGLRWPKLRARAGRLLAQPPGGFEGDEEDHALLAHLREVSERPERASERTFARAREWLQARIGDVSGLAPDVIQAATLYTPRPLAEIDDFRAVIDAIPFVATHRWEELYLPAEVLARLPPDGSEEKLAFVEGPLVRWRRGDRQGPSPSAPTPGRNAPCPCGSGKKHKRCCGA